VTVTGDLPENEIYTIIDFDLAKTNNKDTGSISLFYKTQKRLSSSFLFLVLFAGFNQAYSAAPQPSISTSWSDGILTVTNTWRGRSGSLTITAVEGCVTTIIDTTLSKNRSVDTVCPVSTDIGGVNIIVTAVPADGSDPVIEPLFIPKDSTGDPGTGDPGTGDPGTGDPGPAIACDVDGGEVGVFGTLEGTVSDYIKFDLSKIDQGSWGNGNYLENIRLYIDKQGAGGSSVIFGGIANNSFNQGWETFSGYQLPINSLVIASVTDSSEYQGNNVALPPEVDGKWLLCGTPASSGDYDSYASTSGTYTGSFPASPGGGVNIMGGEYACSKGFGYHHHTALGVSHKELTAMLVAWNVKTVRLPMNEHCWISGIKGEGPYQYIANNNAADDNLINSPENCNTDLFDADSISDLCTTDPDYKVCDGNTCSTQGAGYRSSFKELVSVLNDAQITAVLDLHWTEGSNGSTIDNLDHLPRLNRGSTSTAEIFWESVAKEFNNNPMVYFNLFNEPRIGTGRKASEWVLWRDGGEIGRGRSSGTFVGMQKLVDTIRDVAGNITSPIVVGGVEYGGNGHGLLSHLPYDKTGLIGGDIHSYPGGDYKCWADDGSPNRGAECWNRTLMPLKDMGFGAMIGEAGNSSGSRGTAGCNADVLKYTYDWATTNDVPVLAWTFIPNTNPCVVPSTIHQWPGERSTAVAGRFDLSQEAIDDGYYDDLSSSDDDSNLAGCANAAYLAGYWDRNSVPTPGPGWTSSDSDFIESCVAYFGSQYIPAQP